MSNDELAQDQDFKKWVRSNVIHLVNEVAEKWKFEEEDSYEHLYNATLRSITSEDLDEYLDGDKAPKLGSPEYVELKDSVVEWKQGEIMQYFLISEHLKHWLNDVGGIVIDDLWGLTVWCKRSYGQALEYEWELQQAYKYYKNRNAFSFLTESEVGTDCF